MPRKKKHDRSHHGSVRALPSKKWQARIQRGGADVSLGTYKTETDAWAAIAAHRTDVRRGDYVDPLLGRQTVAEAFTLMIATRPDLKPSAAKDYDSVLRTLVNRETRTGQYIGIGQTPIGDLTAATILTWLARLSADGIGVPSRRKAYLLVGAALELARKSGRLTRNPADDLEIVPRGQLARALRKPHFFATLPEMVALSVAAPAEHRLMIDLTAWTCMRSGEIRALRTEQLMHARQSIHVEANLSHGLEGVQRTDTKSGNTRLAAVPQQVLDRLDAYIDRHNLKPGDLLFPGSGPSGFMHSSTMNKSFDTARTAARLVSQTDPAVYDPTPVLLGNPHDPAPGRRRPITPHDCRATGASMLFDAGVVRTEVQIHLGHAASAQTTDLYTEVRQWGSHDQDVIALRSQGLRVTA
jgi:integrase